MPKKQEKKCYFGCKNVVSLHSFPNPISRSIEQIRRYNVWKSVLDFEVQERGDKYIYESVYLCNNHFIPGCILPSRRLTFNAIPTLQLEHVIPPNSESNVETTIPSKGSSPCLKRKVVCRLCLECNAKVFNLRFYSLNTYFEDLLSIKPDSKDLPQCVCYLCARLLKKYSKFKKKCLAGQEFLNNIIKSGRKITVTSIEKLDRSEFQTQLSIYNLEQYNTTNFEIDLDIKEEIDDPFPTEQNDTVTENHINAEKRDTKVNNSCPEDKNVGNSNCEDKDEGSSNSKDKDVSNNNCEDKNTINSNSEDKDVAKSNCGDKNETNSNFKDKDVSNINCEDKYVSNSIREDKNISISNPGIKNVGISNPGIKNVGNSNREVKIISISNPGIKNMGNSNREDKNVGLCNPGIKNVGLSNLGVKNEGNSNREVKIMSISNPGIKNVGNGNREDKNVGLSNPGIKNVGISNPGIKNVGNSNREDKNVGLSNPGIKNVGISNPGIKNVGNSNREDKNVGLSNLGVKNKGKSNHEDKKVNKNPSHVDEKSTDETRVVSKRKEKSGNKRKIKYLVSSDVVADIEDTSDPLTLLPDLNEALNPSKKRRNSKHKKAIVTDESGSNDESCTATRITVLSLPHFLELMKQQRKT